MSRWPALIHLTGPPASGKRTVAVALVEAAAQRGRRVVLVDNHLTSRPILSVIDNDGVRVLPKEVWRHVHAVRDAVVAAIEELAPPDWSFAFTNYLVEGEPASMDRIQRLAEARGSAYVPVALDCDLDERLARVPNHDRREHLKWTDPDAVRADLDRFEVLVPDGALRIDTTTRSPAESAAIILDALGG